MPNSPSRILISGASGLIGTALIPTLEAQDFKITSLVRRKTTAPMQIEWDPVRPLRPESVSGFDAVIHLAGESVMGLWTKTKKARILNSRVLGTRHLSEALANAPQPPRVLISASATGYYGNRGDDILGEDSASGEGFLPEVCRQWEAATKPASGRRIRTVLLRNGIVLSSAGGALKGMLPAFRLGLGGKLGSGRQWMSWIHIDDVVRAIHHILSEFPASSKDQTLDGPVNMVSPEPVTNAEFTRNLAGALSRPAILTVPGFAARLMLGQMADEIFFASQRVEPVKLTASGFKFKYSHLQSALDDILRGTS